MYFTEIRLINFGQYAGEHVLNLRPPPDDQGRNERPIFLIGGQNGAGKTTILEAVRLCLYGAIANGHRLKRQAYETYLLSRIHRQIGAPLQHTFAGVEVSFTHTLDAQEHTFTIRRMWERKRQGATETCLVRRDGVALPTEEQAWWEKFLHEVLPPALADFFFFDGEQIQALADDADYTLLGTSIRSLLGLDLLHRLHSDLAVYLTRQRRTSAGSLEQQLARIQTQRADIEERFHKAFAELGTLNTLIEQKEGKIEADERLLVREGGDIASRRDMLQQRAEALRADLRSYERMISEQASGLLPFAVIPRLSASLQARLELEEQLEQRLLVTTVAETFEQEFNDQLLRDDQWLNELNLIASRRDQLVQHLRQITRSIRIKLTGSDAKLLTDTIRHDLSKPERRAMITRLEQALTVVPSTMRELGRVLAATTNELATIEATLLHMPATDIVQPILQRLTTMQREMGVLQERRGKQEQQLQQIRQQREALKREEQELYTRMLRGEDPALREKLASRAQQVLVRYEQALRTAKIHELEERIVECFGRLSTKGRSLRRVTIDPHTFATTLYNTKNDALPREQLSAGEKQIYAIAVLWALRLVSGRALPIIIDTPLGRLDSQHRLNLVQHYFPQASHQVLLLSTDTEIDATLYAMLQPDIARTYRLVYQPGTAVTQVVDGYFWSSSPEQADSMTVL